MKTTIDAAGRLVIPKDLRRRAGIRPGMSLDIRWRDGRIEIEPVPVLVELERQGRFLVAVPRTDTDTLTAGMVEETREVIREERSFRTRS